MYPIFDQSGNSHKTFDEGDEIYSLIDGLAPRYRKQLDPYLSYNYSEGFWDKFGGDLGFNTAADKYRMQMQDRARQALVGLLNDQHQDNYNSAKEQAARQREAGLNPDLAGEASGESAAGLEQPMSPIDPAVFEPPTDMLVNIGSLFGTAAQGLSSVSAFTNMLANIRKTKADTTSVQISNVQDAWKYAGDYLTAFDPKTRIDFGDVEFTPDFFNDKIVSSKISALRDSAPGLSEDAYKMIERAMKARSTDPAIMDAYYKNYRSALESKTGRIAAKSVHGSLDLADEVVSVQNRQVIDYQIKAFKSQLEYNAMVNDYNLARTRNDFNFETWKQKYNIPQEIAQTEVAAYIEQRARSSAETLRAQYLENWLTYLKKLEQSGDPGATYLINALLQGGYAPLMSTSINGGFGSFKGSGSWNTLITPGVSQPLQKLGEGVRSTYDPSNPFSWQNQKF